MRTATTKDSYLHGPSTELTCCVCGEKDIDKILVQQIGIAAGIGGNCYSFCNKCWNSKNLGKNILKILGFEHGMRIKEEMMDVKEILP